MLCDIGADVLSLSIGILSSICTDLNICTFNTPTSQSPETVIAHFKNDTETNVINNKNETFRRRLRN